MPVIAVIGNDAGWTQIARDQVVVLGRRRRHRLAAPTTTWWRRATAASACVLDDPERTDEILDQAKALAAGGKPVCINVHIARSEFRKGSISM